MTARFALQLNAVVGLLSGAVASATIWLVLTRPVDVAEAIATHEYGAIAEAIGRELGTWLSALLWYV